LKYDVQGGTPLFAFQELGGWESAEMVRRYAHLAADHLAPYAERLEAVAVVEAQFHATNTSTVVKNEGLASLQTLEYLVAGEGFEPSTFGL